MFVRRSDISAHLVHLIRGDTASDAFETLCKIVNERRLLGGDGYIRGGFVCVCFCEAPLRPIAQSLAVRESQGIRYQPFGIRVSKSWLFAQGGRPVIYQPNDEYRGLPEDYRWRHVRYEPNADPPIDFTWEREWRIQTEELPLDPEYAQILVPDAKALNTLTRFHEREEFYDAWAYSQVLGDAAWGFQEPFPWDAHILEELGEDLGVATRWG